MTYTLTTSVLREQSVPSHGYWFATSSAVWVHVAILWILTATSIANGQSIVPLRHAWETHPDLGNIWETNSDPRAPAIDVEQLDAPEAQIRVRTAQMLSLHHDRDGLNAKSRAVELIQKRFAMGTEPLLIQRAMLSAAVLMDDGSHADEWLAAAKEDSVMLETIDRALIHWKSPAGLKRWRSLLASHSSHPTGLSRAIEGIRWVGDENDVPALLEILRSNEGTNGDRMLASVALGTLDRSPASALAKELLASNLPDRDTLAVNLVQGQATAETQEILLGVLSGNSATARRTAASALVKLFPEKTMELAPNWLTDKEPSLRKIAVESLRKIPSANNLASITPLLDDVDLNVRIAARDNLLGYATAGLRDEVIASLGSVLERGSWRGIEQSIQCLVELRSKDHFDQLLVLLDHESAEVHMHAAWALMELVDERKWIEAVAARCRLFTDQLASSPAPVGKSKIIQGSLLLEVLGKNRHRASLEMLRQYIPKNNFKMGNLTRASAIWSIGQIQSEDDDSDLREQLMARMKDMPPMNPENYLVRFACILALGEFGFRDALPTLNSHGGDPPSPIGYATLWAKAQIEQKAR